MVCCSILQLKLVQQPIFSKEARDFRCLCFYMPHLRHSKEDYFQRLGNSTVYFQLGTENGEVQNH